MIAYCMTTINPPREQALEILKRGHYLYVAGDAKTPDEEWDQLEDEWGGMLIYLSLEDQQRRWPLFTLPTNSYVRKAYAYLAALADGADWIVETDDDNTALESFFERLTLTPENVELHSAPSGGGFANPFLTFAPMAFPRWPRGLSFDAIHDELTRLPDPNGRIVAPLQQGFSNGNPDLDAVGRLVFGDVNDFEFYDRGPAIALGRGTYAPCNSQATRWHRSIAELLYLPVTCTARCTDIWRGYIAQRLLWEVDENTRFAYVGPLTEQRERNYHDGVEDLEQEIDLLRVDRFVDVLQTRLDRPTLPYAYGRLFAAGFFSSYEEQYLRGWLRELNALDIET